MFGRWVDGMLSQKRPIKKGKHIVGYKPVWKLDQLLGLDVAVVPTAEQMRAVFGPPRPERPVADETPDANYGS